MDLNDGGFENHHALRTFQLPPERAFVAPTRAEQVGGGLIFGEPPSFYIHRGNAGCLGAGNKSLINVN